MTKGGVVSFWGKCAKIGCGDGCTTEYTKNHWIVKEKQTIKKQPTKYCLHRKKKKKEPKSDQASGFNYQFQKYRELC